MGNFVSSIKNFNFKNKGKLLMNSKQDSDMAW